MFLFVFLGSVLVCVCVFGWVWFWFGALLMLPKVNFDVAKSGVYHSAALLVAAGRKNFRRRREQFPYAFFCLHRESVWVFFCVVVYALFDCVF